MGVEPAANRIDHAQPRPWGFWATLGFSSIVVAVMFAIAAAVAGAFFIAQGSLRPGVDPEAAAAALSTNGLCMAVVQTVAAPICVALVLLFVALRRGPTVRDYLALRGAPRRQWFQWLLIYVAWLALSDGLTMLLGRPVVPKVMVDVYTTAQFPPLLWLALIVLAPVFEEVFFRGFIFAGVRHSSAGPAAAIVLTALGWAALHIQYDAYSIGIIFFAGLVLGLARLRSGSTLLPMAMHAIQNLVATVQVMLYIHVAG